MAYFLQKSQFANILGALLGALIALLIYWKLYLALQAQDLQRAHVKQQLTEVLLLIKPIKEMEQQTHALIKEEWQIQYFKNSQKKVVARFSDLISFVMPKIRVGQIHLEGRVATLRGCLNSLDDLFLLKKQSINTANLSPIRLKNFHQNDLKTYDFVAITDLIEHE